MFRPKFPLKMSDVDGPYDSIRDIKLNIRQNVKFLLNTSPGEWPGKPTLGIGLRHFLFENNTSGDLLGIDKRIKDQFSKYLPFLEVSTEIVDVDSAGESLVDSNRIKVVIRYNILPLNESDIIEYEVLE